MLLPHAPSAGCSMFILPAAGHLVRPEAEPPNSRPPCSPGLENAHAGLLISGLVGGQRRVVLIWLFAMTRRWPLLSRSTLSFMLNFVLGVPETVPPLPVRQVGTAQLGSLPGTIPYFIKDAGPHGSPRPPIRARINHPVTHASPKKSTHKLKPKSRRGRGVQALPRLNPQ